MTLKNIWIESFHGFVKCKSSSIYSYVITKFRKKDQTNKIIPIWFNKKAYLQKQHYISTFVKRLEWVLKTCKEDEKVPWRVSEVRLWRISKPTNDVKSFGENSVSKEQLILVFGFLKVWPE